MSTERFIEQLHKLVIESTAIAEEKNHEYVTVETLLFALIKRDSIKDIIISVNGNYKRLYSDLEEYLDGNNIPNRKIIPGTQTLSIPRETPTLVSVIQATVARAKAAGKREVHLSDILINIADCSEDVFATYFLLKNNVTPLALKELVSHGDDEDYEVEGGQSGAWPGGQPAQQTKPMSEKRARKILEKNLTNLNIEGLNGRIDPLIGREEEVEKVVQILARRKKNNPVLVGDPGVGKTAIPEGLALRISRANEANKEEKLNEVDPTFPRTLLDTTVWGMSIGDLVAGTKYRGEFEEKLKSIIDALKFLIQENGEKHILFIDEIHTVLGAGSTTGGSLDAGNLLKPTLSKGVIRCIGATTFDEYQKHFEKDRALLRRFKKIDVFEPSDSDCFKILQGLRKYYEEYHGVSYTDEALESAIQYTKKYNTRGFLPDKAIDVIDSVGATHKISRTNDEVIEISKKQILAEVSKIAHKELDELSKDDSEKLSDLFGKLQSVVYGQDEALHALEDAVYLAKAGLREDSKTAGAFLFGGPTGVGKTEIAKQLAKILDVELVRFDMSEYMEKHTVSKLIGAPPGYVGFDSQGGSGSGLFTDAIERTPNCILLLDEVDKAHPDVFNLLLQVMDNGSLTNSNGKHVDFRNVILILSTNAGATNSFKNTIGFGKELNSFNEDSQIKAIEKFFTPEFRNRLDGIIVFNRLHKDVMVKIVDKFISEFNELVQEKKIIVTLTDEAKEWLAEKGYDVRFGARPLARVIQTHIKKPMSREVLFGTLKSGGNVTINVIEDELKLQYS